MAGYQISLDGVQSFLLLGGREEGGAVSALDAVHGDGGLDQGAPGGGGAELPRQHTQVPAGCHPQLCLRLKQDIDVSQRHIDSMTQSEQ